MSDSEEPTQKSPKQPISEDFFRRIVNAIPSMVWISHTDGNVDFFNDKWFELTGQSAASACRMGWLNVVHPDDRTRLLSSIGPPLEDRDMFEIEVRYRMSGGWYRWHMVRALRVNFSDDRDQWFGISIDINDIHASEELFEAQTRAIVATAVDGIITIDAGGIVRSVNPAVEKIFGYKDHEVLGNNISILMPEPYRSEHDHYIANYLRTGTKKIIGIGRQVEGRRKDGTTFPMDLAVSELPLADRRMFTGIVRDISDRKKAEQQMIESQRKLSTLMNNLPGAAYRCLHDRQWVMEFISDGCQSLCGYTPAEIVAGQPSWSELIQDEHEPQRNLVNSALASRTAFQLTYRIRHRSGDERWIWEQGRGIFSENGSVHAIEGLMIDITEQKKAERLAAMGQMLSGIAHESRNALQRIQAAADMLQLELDDNAEAREDLARIMRAREDLQTLFEELRGYAAPIHLDRRLTDLAEIWQQAWMHLESSRAGRKAYLHAQQTSGIDLACKVDGFRIEQVFRNLMENSLSACEDPVHIEIICQTTLHNQSPAIRVVFQDNGPGLTDEQRGRVFETFYTTKSKGTGLGMAIARRIIEAHGGVIRVIGDVNTGAGFEIIIPRAARSNQ